MSDVPIRLSRGLRKTLLSLNKVSMYPSVYPQDTVCTSLSIPPRIPSVHPSVYLVLSSLRPKPWGLVLVSF